MAAAQGPFLATVLLLVSSGLHCSSPLPACPEPCACQSAPQLNCSSSSLSLVPQGIQDSVTDLDLSHNLLGSVTLDRPHYNLRNVWLGNNSITRLSLCIERNLGGRYDRGRHRLRPWSRQGCVSWAPTLQLLSVERNQLEQLPEGLEGSELLQVLQLSFNKISTLRPGDLSHLQQLTELHLQHNLITTLHPQMFQDLSQLQVLDLSFNMLTNLHPLMYLSLRNIGADVRLSENRWQCDCSMRGLRRRMAYDSSRSMKPWSVVCASPSILSGRDLLQLEEDDLNCFNTDNRPELHQDVTVYRGSEILLSCAAQDSVWWTPSGQASVSQPQADLLINDITEKDTGLYLCVSEEHKVVSVFNLQISKIGRASRKTRSLPRTSQQIIPQDNPNRISKERNQTTRATNSSDLALAVCLSILFTFLIAFVLGVLARPCVENLWKRVTKKKGSHETNSVPPVDQRQYDNEAYTNGDDPEEVIPHRERRVTFSTIDYRESTYFDTVTGNDQESINGDEYEVRRSSEENQRDGRTHTTESEHIPDPVELKNRRSSSSRSDSSLSSEDQTNQRGHTAPKSPQLAEDSAQQRVDSRTTRKIVVSQESEISGSSEPFTDWSPHAKDLSLTDPDLWQESGEQFEFSDSVRSASARSSSIGGSFKNSKRILAITSDTQWRDDMSSSSSIISENEPTSYTVNPYPEEDIGRDPNKSAKRYTDRPAKHPSSSSSSDSDVEDHKVIQETTTPSTKDMAELPIKEYQPVSHVRAPLPPNDSSSSSDTDNEITHHTVKQEPGKVDLEHTTRVNRSQDIKAPSLASDSSSSDVETTNQIKRHVAPTSDVQRPRHPSSFSSSDSDVEDYTVKRETTTASTKDMAGLPIKEYQPVSHVRAPLPPTDSSSSSDTDNEITQHTVKQEPGKLDLEHTTRVNRSQDIKAPSLAYDSSSSSGSDVVTTNQIKRQVAPTSDVQRPRHPSSSSSSDSDVEDYTVKKDTTTPSKKDMAGLPIIEYQPVSHIRAPLPPNDSSSSSDTDNEYTTRVNRSQDIKAPSLASDSSSSSGIDDETIDLDRIPRATKHVEIKAPSHSESSSSSDSEDETTNHKNKQDQGKTYMERHPIKVQTNTQTSSPDPQTQWAALDVQHTTQIKNRLTIKPPSQPSDSSSSSDSENETAHHTKKERPELVGISKLPFQESQTVSQDSEKQWPAVNLANVTRIKKRLDIKVSSQPSDSSSSSSDSEDESTNQIKKQAQGETWMERLPPKISQTSSPDSQTQWPLLDLEHTTSIKKRLDVKATSQPSSSSSDSEDETTNHAKKERPELVGISKLPFQESQTVSQDSEKRWPAVDLANVTHIKKRLDIKVSSQPSDSSSSSDSDDERTGYIEKQKAGMVGIAVSQDPETGWRAVDLGNINRVKKCLDIKAPSQPSDSSSSSSDSEDETSKQIKKQEQGETWMERLPPEVSQTSSPDSQTQWPLLDLGDITRIKKRLDIKAPSQPSDSSSSSDSEDETSKQIKKQEQGETWMEKLPPKVSHTSSPDPQTQWPLLDLECITPIKKRLDIKAPSQPSDSSSSSDSEDETTNQIKKQEQGETWMERLPPKVSQISSPDPQTQWPLLDLECITPIKTRLDIKAPSQPSDSSSSSDSEDETTNQIKKQEQGETWMERLPPEVSQTSSPDSQTQWPLLDLGDITRIKKRLDIKAPSQPSDSSSSSSDSEDETTNQIKKQEQRETWLERLPPKVSQTSSPDPQTQWPLLDLERPTSIKKRLDIKAPSQPSDSSSSSDSEDETTNQIKKQEQGETWMERLPPEVSQTSSPDPQTQWPLLDLGDITRIKKRLDIKAPSQPSDSSSSSDSEDETTNQIKKQEQGETWMERLPPEVSQTSSPDSHTQWPLLDLGDITRIKKRLDIKAPSQPSDSSSSSSDSEDETTNQIKKQEQGETWLERLPPKVSQTSSPDPQTQWPLLDLERTTSIKKRLDIKAPSQPSDSSSSSDSEDETTNQIKKQEQGETWMERLPPEVSQTSSPDSQTQWPLLDLGDITRIKKRLDIKAPSQPSDSSSSSSDSEDETTNQIKKQEQGETWLERLPPKVSQTSSPDPQTQWPLLDLERPTSIKKRLDIKAPSQPSDSSSSSDSEDETTNHAKKERPELVGISKLPFQESQTVSQDSEKKWPAVDLGDITRIKKRLDIKAPSQPSDSSSSSDSEDETTNQIKKQEQGETWMERLPPKESQTSSPDSQTQWPLLDLGDITRIKKRLDIKAPSQPSDSSSSSSDSEDETTNQIKTQEQGETWMERLPPKESQTSSPDSQTQWPLLDLGDITRIKKRLDIKAPSQPSDSSSSSSDSEDETTNQIKTQEQGETWLERLPPKVSQTSSPDPQTQWPLLDLERPTSIKKRLDIKAPSQPSDSSSSSDSEDETTNQIKKQEQGETWMERLPPEVSQTSSPDPQTQWPLLDLGDITRIKKRLDIKAPSQPSDSSSSSDSEDETTNQIKKQEQGETWMERLPPKVSHTSSPDPQTQWPLLDLERPTSIKKRLDIKAPSQPSDSSSSSDSEDETTNQIKKQEQRETWMERLPPEVSQTSSPDSQTQWPLLDLGDITRIKKRLDIKAPSQPSDSSSSSSDSEDETTNQIKKQEQGETWMERLPPKISQTSSPDPQTQWPLLDLERTTSIKKRLDIKAPSQPSDSSSSSDSEDETTNHAKKERPELVGISKLPFQESQTVSQDSEKKWPAVDLGDITRIKKRLDIKVSSQPSDSSSSSDSEDEATNHTNKMANKMEDLHNSPTTIKHSGFGTLISSSPKKDHKITLEKYQVITNEMRDEKTSGKTNTPPEVNSELEARWTTMNLGTSRFRKRLDISPNKREPPKLPSSPPPALDLSGMTENDSLITYKRLIFKPSSPLSNSSSHSDPTIDQANKRQTHAELVTVAQGPSHSMGDRSPSLAPTRVSSMTFDDVVRIKTKQSRHTINVDVPPEIRWTGIGRYLSDPSISSQMDKGLSTTQQPPPAEPELPTPPDSSNSSLSTSYISHASSRAFDKVDNSPSSSNEILRVLSISEQKRERKGLSAIKAMSSERQQWDTQEASLFDDHGPQVDTSFNYAKHDEDVKPLAKEPLTRLHTSSTYSTVDLLYDIPHYKSHDTPPPFPATPPPDEAVELTWGSLQSSKKQGLEGTGSYLQQSRNTETSDPSSITSQNLAGYIDSSDISHV